MGYFLVMFSGMPVCCHLQRRAMKFIPRIALHFLRFITLAEWKCTLKDINCQHPQIRLITQTSRIILSKRHKVSPLGGGCKKVSWLKIITPIISPYLTMPCVQVTTIQQAALLRSTERDIYHWLCGPSSLALTSSSPAVPKAKLSNGIAPRRDVKDGGFSFILFGPPSAAKEIRKHPLILWKFTSCVQCLN